jgi:hypothetical protein
MLNEATLTNLDERDALVGFYNQLLGGPEFWDPAIIMNERIEKSLFCESSSI